MSFTGCSASKSGGAVFSSSGNVEIANCSFSRSSVASMWSRGGAVSIEAASGGTVTINATTFERSLNFAPFLDDSIITSPLAASVAVNDAAFSPDPTFGQGKGGALFIATALGGPPLSVRIAGSRFERNHAIYGGAVAVPGGGAVALDVTDTTIANGWADQQAAGLFVGPNVTLNMRRSAIVDCAVQEDAAAMLLWGSAAATLTDVQLRNNTAGTKAGAVALFTGATLALSGGAAVNNSAFGGGFAYVASGAALTAGGVFFAGNSATTGGVFLLDSAQQGAPQCDPPCDFGDAASADVSNTAPLGPVFATFPTSAQVVAPTSVQSGEAFEAALLLTDGFGQTTESWPGLVVDAVSSTEGGNVTGVLYAPYVNRAAVFAAVVVRGAVGSRPVVKFNLRARTLGALDGLSVTHALTVSPCSPLVEQYDELSQRCACSPGSARSSNGSCALCAGGTVAPGVDAGQCQAR